MIELSSYVAGKWTAGEGKASDLVNPATEAIIARTSTAGIDMGSALAYARDVGGPALRALTFAQRGEALRVASKVVHAHRDELIKLAIENGGNTRGDAKFDIDGAIGTLAFYGDLGVQLGAVNVLEDGESIQLGRSPRLHGAHAFVPRCGVAVHVNAFNFPAWGLAEKAACAWLAGMPVVTKPATSTALVAWRTTQLLVEAGALPDGALSLLAGSAGDLLDRLTGQDVLAFTGSSQTGALLRGGRSVVANNVRVNVEADSLNAAVLGPDASEGSETLNLFIGDVARDITQKTGQKCTAIRRVYVPRELVGIVVALLDERLAGVKVGNPADDGVNMGPVSTAQQLADVRAGIGRLASVGKIVRGGSDALDGVGGAPAKGFFIAPTLVVSESPDVTDFAHNHEVFGPVATVMVYDGSAASAVALVSGGGGGLVTSVYSDDKDFVRNVVLGIAPFHGRVTIGSEKIAAQAMAPGMVLPSLIHGGPGRAGGGEELGGRRGLAFYMQRVALQGDRALLEAILGKRPV
jgi:oxepin-CoA hydrolase/3-oxo-5,6-dehydrosuberyl-CoA semialdehyde dehydrogenase